ncbi:cysteine-rich CWC family protein [Collimonas fungivorans]|uniref:Cysteine-rich CWC family protein n=1 Tax=Collimonas fungivorans TaxID=158899 RepID=A0A127PIY9_9BURK|nr:cysteine-rich CWC family protein [Collimonas fungivorans]AMO97685.1 cysteine-rich CWC family protein [Collimonas fungivorans]
MAQCPACRQQFSCGAGQHPDQPCWCSRLPPLASAKPAATECYCPDCLQRLLRQEQTGEKPAS